jgi:iron-sulfur cluster repair protein YtfE (RIC family)
MQNQAKMIQCIISYYHAHGRMQIPTMSTYCLEDVMKVMRLFQLPMDDILSAT